jgi:hypothetical protein
LKQLILAQPSAPEGARVAGSKRELKQVSHFRIEKTLGEGTFGKVKLGI